MPVKIKNQLVKISFNCTSELFEETQRIKSLKKQHPFIDYDVNVEANYVLLKRLKSDRIKMEELIAEYGSKTAETTTAEPPPIPNFSLEKTSTFPQEN